MMKKTTLLLIALFTTVVVSAQVPSAFNFQAVLRDAKGDLYQNKEVIVSVILLEDNVTTIYKTSLSTKSDSLGMIQLSIPQKEIVAISEPLSKVLSSVTGSIWMQMSVYLYDIGESIEFPSQQLVSVPYSMMSGNVMLTSPNGNKYSLKVDDNGILSASLVNGVDSTSNRVPSRKYIALDGFGLNSKVTIHKFKGVIRTQQEYETLLGKVPLSKVDFTKYSLVLFVESVVLKDFYLEKISDTQYKFKRVPTSGGVIDDIAYGLLIPKIDESVTIDFSVDSPWK
jgi:hypothetical protein